MTTETALMAPTIDPVIFNTQRDYRKSNGSLFLGEQPGLLDSINRNHPRIWELYKKLKKLDWDENEFNYSECQVEFETGKQEDIDKMISSLAWQWESDSIAAHCIIPLFAPFVSSSELWAAYVQVGQNEIVHGLTYSEIVRNGFRDPDAAMQRVLDSIEPLKRLSTIAKVFAEAARVGAHITLGMVDRHGDYARDTVMRLVFALFALERIQFMASFAITFAFGEVGRFAPITKAVQKICNEEFSVHVEIGRYVIKNELSTQVGRESFARIKSDVAAMFFEVTNSELSWTKDHLFADGKELPGCTSELVCKYVLYNANDCYETAGIDNPFPIVKKLPLHYMAGWIDVDKNQISAQEEKGGNYLLGGFINTAGDKVYSTVGL